MKFEWKGIETNYVLFRTEQGASKQTVRNEMASINACQRHLCDIEQITSFPRFRLPSLKIEVSASKSGEEVQRMTFTHDEWKSFYTSMRSYVAKAKPFPSVKPPQSTTSNATSQATPNSAVGSQSFTSKDISDIRNDYLQKQSELQPIKPQSPF